MLASSWILKDISYFIQNFHYFQNVVVALSWYGNASFDFKQSLENVYFQ